jgi:hypothetical protein
MSALSSKVAKAWETFACRRLVLAMARASP